ncbi:MAG: hypothetical protein GY820_21855, partial [Gammaproteobacteria bacterium]|nr:hypothetical protein [Gammaproteobacteria bacterium]
MQKQEENLQRIEDKMEENRQADLQRQEENRVADQDRFSEALIVMEQRQDAVENLLNKKGGDEQSSLHNASVSRMGQRDKGEEVSSDEDEERQSRKYQNGQKFKNANDSLKKGKTRKQSTSQDARCSTGVKYTENGVTTSGRVFRNSALDHSPEVQPILKRPPISTKQHRSHHTEPTEHTSTPMQNHPGNGNGQNFQNHGQSAQRDQGQNSRPPNGQLHSHNGQHR